MKCGICMQENDQDAAFCANCGKPLAGEPAPTGNSRKRPYVFALLLLPAALIAAVIGYYKFILPEGIAAVVNGEEIALSEVEGMLQGTGKGAPEETQARMRYAILSNLITERIACQEAKKAGLTLSPAEVDDAYNRAQMSSGRDQDAFRKLVSSQYGSVQLFRAALERRAVIRKYIAERLAAGSVDPELVNNRMNRWLQEAVSRSAVRIALAEQAPASGCGCCNTGAAGTGKNVQPGGAEQSAQAREAQQAALAYWTKTHGDGQVDTKLTDFGCHIQVDIIKEKKIAKSLRYQNGAITEM